MSYPIFRTGVNIDPVYWPANPNPQYPGGDYGMDKIHGFRVVSREEVASYCDNAKAQGKHILSVVTGQSIPPGGDNEFIYAGSDIVQLGNEPDLNGQTPAQYADYANHLYGLIQQYGLRPYVALAGLGDGLGNNGPYLQAVLPLLDFVPDMVAVHCYDGDTSQSEQEILELWNVSQIAVIVTEWNKKSADIWGMLEMLNGPNARSSAWNSYYPYTTAMNPTTQGLVDHINNPTVYGESFVSAPYV